MSKIGDRYFRDTDTVLEKIIQRSAWVELKHSGGRVNRLYFYGEPGDRTRQLDTNQISQLIKLGKISINGQVLKVEACVGKASFIQPAKKRKRPCMKCRKEVLLPEGIYRCDKCHSAESEPGIRRMRSVSNH